MIEAIDIGLGLLETFLGRLKNKLPAEVVAAIQDAYDALDAHKQDLITKANLEAQRG
jgi:hypothetical protein